MIKLEEDYDFDEHIEDGDDELTNDEQTIYTMDNGSIKKRNIKKNHNNNIYKSNSIKDDTLNSGNLGYFDYFMREIESLGDTLFTFLLNLFKNIKLITFLSIIVHFVSIYLLFTLPSMGSNTYVSEKNLQCTVKPFITKEFSENAIEYSNQFNNLFPKRSFGSIENLESAKWIQAKMIGIGVETQLHYFNSSFDRVGVNIIGVNRAPRSLGTESFVLTTAFDQWHSAGSVGFMLSFLEYLKSTDWQARDVLFVFTSEGGLINGGTLMDVSGISVWANDYISADPIGWVDNNPLNTKTTSSRLLRAGYIYGAIALDRVGNSEMEKLVIYPEGLGGVLSNLDLINVITTTSYLNEIPAGIITQRGMEEDDGSVNGLLVFMWNSAISMARSNHAIFTKYGINSVGVSTYSNHNVWDFDFMNTPIHFEHNSGDSINLQLNYDNKTMFNLGKIIETSIRHLHNADEQLHQSYSWYMMAGAVYFIDLGQALLPIIIFSVSLGLILISILVSVENLNRYIIESLPWFLSILSFCSLELLLPKLLIHLQLLPSNRNLKPANLLTGILEGYSIEDQILTISILFFIGCIIVYFTIIKPFTHYFVTLISIEASTHRMNNNINHSLALHSLFIAYYGLLSLMGMMLNNQFTCLFIVLSIPTIHITTWILLSNVSKLSRVIWIVLCLVSHPLFILLEWWSTSTVGWKHLFIGILIGNEWGFLFWPFFVLLLQPIWIGIVKLLFFSPQTLTEQQQSLKSKLKKNS